ncbi:hypothetical protein NPIL_199251 [Nephila pilipes]|nr:hypothetical protein NPIL_199251 [Nephila pilipes]
MAENYGGKKFSKDAQLSNKKKDNENEEMAENYSNKSLNEDSQFGNQRDDNGNEERIENSDSKDLNADKQFEKEGNNSEEMVKNTGGKNDKEIAQSSIKRKYKKFFSL